MDFSSLAIGFLLGATCGYAIKVGVDWRTQKNVHGSRAVAKDNSIAQSGNIAGGHIAAGDITTRDE